MTKLLTCFVIFITGTLFQVDISWQALYPDPSAYRNGKCYFRGGVYKPGENMYDQPRCMKWGCSKINSTSGSMVGVSCGVVVASPPCKVTPLTTGIYPKCCPRRVCP
uniref:8.9 kDa family member n=1 Tax=Rhipicephalus appendiculatus TaxID=34631 RepID=A0A131YR00_RHIAP